MALHSRALAVTLTLVVLTVVIIMVLDVLTGRPVVPRPVRDSMVSSRRMRAAATPSPEPGKPLPRQELAQTSSPSQLAAIFHSQFSSQELAASTLIQVPSSKPKLQGTSSSLRHSSQKPTLAVPSSQSRSKPQPIAPSPKSRFNHSMPSVRKLAWPASTASTGFTLTGEDGPSIASLQDQMTQCSLAMGISQQSLESRESAINSVATNLSLYLTALRSIIPREFSAAYRSPCWESPLALPERLPRGFYNLNKHNFTEWLKVRRHLYLSLILRALYSKERVLQCLPSFFLAGFPKCGTTTVHTALYHSRLIPELKKEPHWWTRMHLFLHDLEHLQVATARYLNYFYHVADTTVKENHQLLLYDGSQSTLWDSNFVFSNGQDYCAMPTAVSNILPSAKFIVVMREPASRTYSHYRYSCTMKRLETPGLEEFHDTAQADVDHFSQCLSANNTAFECASSISHKKTRCGTLGYRLMVSLYYIHLHKWLQFYPRENFLYLRLEDLARNPMAFMLRITKFLNIPNTKAIDFRWVQHHKQNKQMPYKSMLPETKVLLSKFFHPFNKKLVELTGDSGFLWQDI